MMRSLVFLWGSHVGLTLVHLAVTAKVGDNGEVTTAPVDITGECWRMLELNDDKNRQINLRFSPVWLYMWV